jgi:hypothetical protein
MEYPVSCSPSVSLPDGWKKYESGDFISIPKDIILVIANHLICSHKGVIERVSRYFLSIIRLRWPPMPELSFLIPFKYKDRIFIEARFT